MLWNMTRRRTPTEWEIAMASRLRALRNAAGMTQQQVADAVDVTIRGYQLWEYGKRSFDFETGVKLAEAFGVDLNVLAGKEPLPKRKGGAK
jgi:transcriptional regulator with XRE-family HTH domain